MHFTICRISAAFLIAGLGSCQSAPSEDELRRYQSLSHTLDLLSQVQQQGTSVTVDYIADAVEGNRWQPRDVEVLRQARAIQARTDSMTGYLRQLRRRLHQAAPPGEMAATAPVKAVLLDAEPTSAADMLQQKLNDYARYIRQFAPEQPALLAPGTKDDVRISAEQAGALQTWTYPALNFQDVTRASALATLARQEVEVRQAGAAALDKLSEKVGYVHCGVIERIGAVAVPVANQVRAGESYRAALFLTSSRAIYGMVMQANGHPLKVGLDGRAWVQFAVPRAAPQGPAFWKASIQTKLRGRDTTYQACVPYLIKRR